MMKAIDKSAKIFVPGHKGMVGSAIIRNLKAKGYRNILTKSREELDLLDQKTVQRYLNKYQPDYIFIAAAKVGGIQANNIYRADFIYQNLMIETNLIHGAHLANIQRLCFLGSSCIYPRDCPQPIKEDYLLTGSLEQTNEPYAIAKIAGIKLCESYNRQYGRQYICVMPTNLYGPNDNYDLNNSHVLPALIRKTQNAKCNSDPALTVWGTGRSMREFLYVDDLAEACIFLMESSYEGELLNVGTGKDLTIKELADKVVKIVGFEGELIFDTSKPDGAPRKLLDLTRIQALGWEAKVDLESGIALAYADFCQKKC
jgi:GDP-L-fucose synthase